MKKKLPLEFKISIDQNQIITDISEFLSEVDIIDLLSFDPENIEELLETHAASQSYWEALAVRLENRKDLFESEWRKKWWAHNKVYARLVLASQGELKPTIDAITDMVILIYSEDSFINSEMWMKYFQAAFAAASKKGEVDKEDFNASMFKYTLMDPPWYFETVTRTSNKLKENYELVHTIAKKLDSRSYHLDHLINLIKAKRGNLGPITFERDLINEVSRRSSNNG